MKLGELAQRIADSRLVWLADAWRPSLSVYAAAKALATRQGALRTLVQALSPVFANPKSTKKGTHEVRAEDIEVGIADWVLLEVLRLARETLRGVLHARFWWSSSSR
jgi:hypothetical protein